MFVHKLDGSLHFTIDYHIFNKANIHDRCPLSSYKDLFSRLRSARCFSSLDPSSGYWQVRIADSDVYKTIF